MFKKTILIISFYTMYHINAENADDTWQKYNQKHHEAKEAHFKRERQRDLRQAAENVRFEDPMENLQVRCLEGDCTACIALKVIMQQKLEERKKHDEALFKEILLHTEKINIILKDRLLSDAEKKDLVRPLQEKVIEFEKKLDQMGQWNFTIGHVHPTGAHGYQHLLRMDEEKHNQLKHALDDELGSYEHSLWGKKGRFWIGKLADISLIAISYHENAKSVCSRVPTPTLHKFVTELFRIRIIKYLNALEEIIQRDCKDS